MAGIAEIINGANKGMSFNFVNKAPITKMSITYVKRNTTIKRAILPGSHILSPYNERDTVKCNKANCRRKRAVIPIILFH